MKTPQNLLLLSLLLGAAGVGCEDSDSESDTAAVMQDAVLTYSKIVSASYADSLKSAKSLDDAVSTFLNEPSKGRLNDARKAWLNSREPYLQTEVFRFYEGPIDNAKDGPEGMLNAWPLDEAYIDYVEGDESAGIINDVHVEISKEALMALNEEGGEANIATGYHAIEFLLWGQDHSDDGPGDRSHKDYIEGEDSAAHPERRADYLSTVSGLLVEHLDGLNESWKKDADNYRADFETADAQDGVSDILTGMIILSGFETGGERLQPALDLGDQEDEHSCFSDNTHRDMIQDVQGVLNVYLGTYERLDGSKVEGTGIIDVVESFDEELAEELEDKIRESLALAKGMEVPFDQAISLDNDSGREGVADLITSLREQESLLEDVFRGLEFEIPEAE